MMSMVTKAKDLFYQYYNQFMTWYNAADDVIQIAVLVVSGVTALFVLGIIFLSRLTKC
jgi:hypothetical protein